MAQAIIMLSLVGLFILHAVARCLARAHLSSLNKIPNAHPLAPYTGLWSTWLLYRAKNLRAVEAAHAKLGPVVRLGPNELSVNCVEDGIKTIYGSKAFDKHHFYKTFQNFGVDTMTTAFDAKQHTTHRKRPGNLFGNSFVLGSGDMKALMQEILYERLQPFLANAVSADPIDVMPVSRGVSMDIWTAYVFGLRHSTRLLDDPEQANEFHKMVVESRPRSKSFWSTELPGLTTFLTSQGFKWFSSYALEQSDRVDAWCLQTFDNLELEMSQIKAGKKPPFQDGENPVVYTQYKSSILKEGSSQEPTVREYTTLPRVLKRTGVVDQKVLTRPRSPLEVALASELMDSTLAMNHVYPVLIIYCFYYLSKYPDIQQRLRAELRSIARPSEEPGKWKLPDLAAVDHLPFLDAVMNETLRIGGPNPGQELRITPKGRRTRLGHFDDIPGGVVVSSTSFALHRTREVFPEPEAWRPDRWLPESKDLRGNGEQNKHLWPFSSGVRGCIGKAIGTFWAKHIVAAIYTDLQTSLVGDVEMQPEGRYIIAPKATELKLIFSKV